MTPKIGYIYYLKGLTAPKVFNGLNFNCLLTEQLVSLHWDIASGTGIHISCWNHPIHKPERFAHLIIDSPGRERIRAAIDKALNELKPMLNDKYKRPGN